MNKKYDVCSIGNALLDYEIEVEEAFFQTNGVEKGLMTLVDSERQHQLVRLVEGKIKKKQGGGSAANTIFGLGQFGGAGFCTCKVADDDDGRIFIKDLTDNGIDTNLNSGRLPEGTTGKCLIMISPDAERTMNTFLGITTDFSVFDLDEEVIKNSNYLYIEGYLVASETGREAMKEAKKIAEKNDVKVSLTFSDPSMVKYFKEQMQDVVGASVDLLFCNEEEVLLYTGKDSLSEAREELKKDAKRFAITQGKNGAMIFDGDTFIDIEPYPVKAVDTTGAGDMFSGAFLYAINHGHSYAEAGKLASLASSKIVVKFGPRLEKEQVKEILSNLSK